MTFYYYNHYFQKLFSKNEEETRSYRHQNPYAYLLDRSNKEYILFIQNPNLQGLVFKAKLIGHKYYHIHYYFGVLLPHGSPLRNAGLRGESSCYFCAFQDDLTHVAPALIILQLLANQTSRIGFPMSLNGSQRAFKLLSVNLMQQKTNTAKTVYVYTFINQQSLLTVACRIDRLMELFCCTLLFTYLTMQN